MYLINKHFLLGPFPQFHSSTATSLYVYKSRVTLRANCEQCFNMLGLKVVFFQGIILSAAALYVICTCHLIPFAPSQPCGVPCRRMLEAFVSLAFGSKVAPAVTPDPQLQFPSRLRAHQLCSISLQQDIPDRAVTADSCSPLIARLSIRLTGSLADQDPIYKATKAGQLQKCSIIGTPDISSSIRSEPGILHLDFTPRPINPITPLLAIFITRHYRHVSAQEGSGHLSPISSGGSPARTAISYCS